MNRIEITVVVVILCLGLLPTVFAATSTFDIDVKDSDETHSYKVCLADVDVAPLPNECIDFKGSEFATNFASFDVEDLTIGYPQTLSLEDLSTHNLAYKKFDNFPQNPEVITISMKDAGPARETQTTENGDTTTTWTDPKTGLVYEVLAEGEYCIDMNNDSICDVTFVNGKMILDERTQPTPTPQKIAPQVEDAVPDTDDGSDIESGNDNDNDNNDNDNDALPYCDKFDDIGDWPDSGCHDRRDVDSETGIATCNDGTHKKDWRDCKDASGYDYDDNNDESNDDNNNNDEDTGGSNPEGEEEDQSCGGESCSDDEKEDSTTDEDDALYD